MLITHLHLEGQMVRFTGMLGKRVDWMEESIDRLMDLPRDGCMEERID